MEEGWKEGTATGLAMRRCASEWAVRSKPRKCCVLGADSFDAAGGHGVVHHPMAQDGGAPAGSRLTATSKEMTQEPGRPIRSVENRRPQARETGAEAECEVGVGGPHKSEDAGERVTPDPAEQRGSARVGTNFRREP
jgi:hypothetical protein